MKFHAIPLRKNCKPSSILGLILVGSLLTILSSCGNWVVSSGSTTGTITGKILDARTGSGISGVTVTVSDGLGDTYSGTTTSSGAWSLTASVAATYTVSAAKTGYFFTTPPAATVMKLGQTVASPVIAGLDLTSYTATFSFILVWNGTPTALQMHLSLPDNNYANAANMTGINPESPNWTPTTSALIADWNAGFGPNGNNSSGTLSSVGRIIVGPTGTGFTGKPKVTDTSGTEIIWLDQDGSTGAPSTITITDFPVTTGYSITPDAYNKFASSDTLFEGVAELYVSAPSENLSTATDTSNAVVYVIGNSSGTAKVFGVYTIPTNTPLTTVSVARVNIMDNEFQIIPDISVVPDGNYRAVAGQSAANVISIQRTKR